MLFPYICHAMSKTDLAAPSQYTDFKMFYTTKQIVLPFICRAFQYQWRNSNSFYAHVANKVITALFNNKM